MSAYETPKANAVDAVKFIWWLIVDTTMALFGKGIK